MRVKIEGKKNLEQLKDYLDKFLDQAKNLGITYVNGTNIYFNPIDENGNDICITKEDGEEIGGWTYKPPKKIQKMKSARIIRLAVNNENK